MKDLSDFTKNLAEICAYCSIHCRKTHGFRKTILKMCENMGLQRKFTWKSALDKSDVVLYNLFLSPTEPTAWRAATQIQSRWSAYCLTWSGIMNGLREARTERFTHCMLPGYPARFRSALSPFDRTACVFCASFCLFLRQKRRGGWRLYEKIVVFHEKNCNYLCNLLKKVFIKRMVFTNRFLKMCEKVKSQKEFFWKGALDKLKFVIYNTAQRGLWIFIFVEGEKLCERYLHLYCLCSWR